MSVKSAKLKLNTYLAQLDEACDGMLLALKKIDDAIVNEDCHCEKQQLDMCKKKVQEARYAAKGVVDHAQVEILKRLK